MSSTSTSSASQGWGGNYRGFVLDDVEAVDVLSVLGGKPENVVLSAKDGKYNADGSLQSPA